MTLYTGAIESFATGRYELLVTLAGSGRPLTYNLRSSDGWKAYRIRPGDPPITSGGRFAYGERTIFYIAPGGQGLWARRFHHPYQPLLSPGMIWYPISAAPIKGAASIVTGANEGNVFLWTGDGLVSHVRWGPLGLRGTAAVSFTDGAVGEPYMHAISPVTDWTGMLTIREQDPLPPGLSLTVNGAGQLVLFGVPTTAGTFTFTARAFDDLGELRMLTLSVTVRPTGLPVSLSQPISPVEAVQLINCTRNRVPLQVWTRAGNSGTGWTRGALPTLPPSYTGAAGTPRCEPAPGATLEIRPSGLTEVLLLDLDGPHCLGVDDPELLGCHYFRMYITGVSGTGVLPVFLGGPV